MAARRDEWLSRAEAKRPDDVAELLATLRDTSVPKLEQRLMSLTHFPRTPAIGDAAVAFLNDFPVKVAENLTLAAVAVGLVVIHGAKPSALKRDVTVLERLAPWRTQVLDALRTTLEVRATPSTKRLENLDTKLAALPDGPGTKVTLKAAELLGVVRDARIGEAAASLLQRPPVKFDAANAYFTTAALLLSVHGGPAQRDVATALTSKLPQLSWLERTLPNDDATASTKTVTHTSEEDFLRLIAEDPSDESRVAVFTDWLLERGDPRGEFNALQRAGKTSATLQKKHEKQWLRSLGRAARRGSTVFRGGLPREVELLIMNAADVPLANEPVLATIESLEFVSYQPTNALLESPMLKSLTTLVTSPGQLAQAPTSLRAKLRTVGIRGDTVGFIDVDTFAPNATTLRLVDDWQVPERLRALPKRITHLDVQTSRPASWFAFASQLKTLDVRPAYWRQSEDGKRRVQFHFEDGRLTRIDCDGAPDERALETFCFEPLQTLKPAQRRGAVSNVKFKAAQQARFDSLCG